MISSFSSVGCWVVAGADAVAGANSVRRNDRGRARSAGALALLLFVVGCGGYSPSPTPALSDQATPAPGELPPDARIIYNNPGSDSETSVPARIIYANNCYILESKRNGYWVSLHAICAGVLLY